MFDIHNTFITLKPKQIAMRLNSLLLLSMFVTGLISCKNGTDQLAVTDTAKTDGHPSWIMQGNIYEVNVRQYTPEGTFKAFEKHLDRLKDMGVQTLWFMPINPISKTNRKGSLGSYYAVSDYTAVNPEFGTMDDWRSLVNQCHDKGFKVIIDWVPNHTGADHYWLARHPGFYVRDSSGKAMSQFDWTDTRKLNYNNPELADTMITQMKQWITGTGIDGFRCDYAVGPARSFWKRCVAELKAVKNVFMLAESDSAWLHQVGFDATYTWPDFNMMKLIAAGKRNASSMDSVINRTDTTFPSNALRLYFTSNHDENSWNQADFATMPGDSHAPFAVLTQTIKRAVPLIYSGQEEPVLRAIRFFDKDTMAFGKYARADFYRKLLLMHQLHPALAANAAFTKLLTDKDQAIYAFYRKSGPDFVVVILNLSKETQHVKITGTIVDELLKEPVVNLQDGSGSRQLPLAYDLAPWGYRVIMKKNKEIDRRLGFTE
ncbi:MAG: alpha-amylase family glycosyl hydrolase [Sediminibacterium sp.]